MDEELEMAIEELSEPLTILAAEMPAPAIDGSKTEGPVEGLPLLKFAALPVLGVVVAVGLLGWALAAIDVRPLFQSEALNGMIQFAKELLPASLAEARALPWARLFASLLETIQMALIGTFAGIVLSLPLAILASRQSSPAGIRHAVRFGLNVIRTVPSIIWALVFVAAVGLGPLSGICALAIYSVGYLTKFFYEALENADDRPALALCALGATRLQSFMTAMLPASKPALIGACLFVFEYNIRSASVLGVVGAGGIGADLMYYIEWRNFPAAMAGLLLILVVVVALDGLSGLWRRRVGAQRGI
jgi:phosphonate transport system permease protein